MIIQIAVDDAYKIGENSEEFMGAPIDDYDDGVLWVVADLDDVEIQAKWWQVKEPFEFWGEKGFNDITEYEIHTCTWHGYVVLNGDDVFEKKELWNE